MKNIFFKTSFEISQIGRIVKMLLLGIFMTSLMSSCGEDFFSTTVEIEIPEHESKLTLAGKMALEDTIITAQISKSLGILSNEPYPEFPNGKVELFENGSLLTTLEYNPSSQFYTAKIAPGTLKSGVVYRMEAQAADFEKVVAEQKMPAKPDLVSATFEKDGGLNEFGERTDELKITLKDKPNESNYYLIRAYQVVNINGIYQQYELYLESRDPLIQYGWDDSGSYYEPLIFSDAAFEGKEFKIQINAEVHEQPDAEGILVKLFEITRDRYLFLNSYYQFYYNGDNPFAEPVNVHNNIENGYGIFSLEAAAEFFIPQ